MEALQAVAASLAALADLAHLTSDEAPDGGNPLRELADSCLDGLEELARLEARTAALKVRLAADFAAASGAMSSSTSSPQERTARTMAVEAEIACVLTISGGAAGALLDAGVRVTPPCYQSTPRLRTSWWMRLLMSSLTNRMRSIPSMPRSEGSSVSHTS